MEKYQLIYNLLSYDVHYPKDGWRIVGKLTLLAVAEKAGTFCIKEYGTQMKVECKEMRPGTIGDLLVQECNNRLNELYLCQH